MTPEEKFEAARWQTVCKPYLDLQQALLLERLDSVDKGMVHIVGVVTHMSALIEGDGGHTGLRMKVDRLEEDEKRRVVQEGERSALRVRVIGTLIATMFIALGGLIATAIMNTYTVNKVQAVAIQQSKDIRALDAREGVVATAPVAASDSGG
jgi:hypothetical protein